MSTPNFMEIYNGPTGSLEEPSIDYAIDILKAFLQKAEHYWGPSGGPTVDNIPAHISTCVKLERANERRAELLRDAIKTLLEARE